MLFLVRKHLKSHTLVGETSDVIDDSGDDIRCRADALQDFGYQCLNVGVEMSNTHAL